MYGSALAIAGYRAMIARNGVEAVTVFRQHLDEISVVIARCRNARMNGLFACAQIRELVPTVPVLFIAR